MIVCLYLAIDTNISLCVFFVCTWCTQYCFMLYIQLWLMYCEKLKKGWKRSTIESRQLACLSLSLPRTYIILPIVVVVWHIYTHARTHTRAHARTHAHTYTHTHTHTHTHTCIHFSAFPSSPLPSLPPQRRVGGRGGGGCARTKSVAARYDDSLRFWTSSASCTMWVELQKLV